MAFVSGYSSYPKQFKIRYLSQLQMIWRDELASRKHHAVCQWNGVTAILCFFSDSQFKKKNIFHTFFLEVLI